MTDNYSGIEAAMKEDRLQRCWIRAGVDQSSTACSTFTSTKDCLQLASRGAYITTHHVTHSQ